MRCALVYVWRVLFVGIAAIALAVLASGSLAQTATSSILGTVSDPQGRAVAGAKVTVSDAQTSIAREMETDEQGRFQFLALQPGSYVVRVEAKGFRSVTTKKIQALVATPEHLDVKMELGSINETITVEEGAVTRVNTTDATIGNEFDSKRVLALPFEGRDAAAVLSLQPGAVFTGTETASASSTVDQRNGAINGGRSDQANITLDGVDNNDQLTGRAFLGAVRSTLDSIEEFRVTTAGVNADQGRSSGGQVALVTKSGTNEFHGSAYMQNRSNIGHANEWFNKHTQLNNGQPNTPPTLVRNVFGASLGGPVWKDRLFFFGTYEGRRQNEASVVTENVPSATMRDGVVLYPCASPAACAGGSVTGVSGKSYPVASGTFGVGPTEIKSMDLNCGKPQPGFPNGTCPLGNGPNPAVLDVFKQYPAANSGTCGNADGYNFACFTFASPLPLHENTSIAKLDYNINKSGTHRVFVRGNYQADINATAQQFPGAPPSSINRDTSRALAIGYSAVFSSAFVNTFRYGYTRQSSLTQGLQTVPIARIRYFDNLNALTATSAFHVPVHNWTDDVSWIKGKHTVQFGVNLRLINNVRSSNATSFNDALVNPLYLNAQPVGSGGSLDPAAQANGCAPTACPWSFPDVDPNNLTVYNNAIVDLVGIVSQVTGNYNRDKSGKLFGQGDQIPRHFKTWEYEGYLQDVWHASSNLTITAGLRYTLLAPPYEVNGNQAAPDLSLHDFVEKRAQLAAQGKVYSPTFGFDLSGPANGRAPYWGYDFKNLGPRVAIAYSPSPSGGLLKSIFGGAGKSSIRAGFGIVYDHFGQGIVNTFDQNGTFGFSSSVGNSAAIQTIDGGARFSGLTVIPTKSAAGNGILLAPPPSGGFPATHPVSTVGNGVQEIQWGLDDKLKTPYSEMADFSVTRELPGGLVFSATYVGRFARRLLQQRDLAMPVNLVDPKSGTDYFTAATLFSKAFYSNTAVANIKPIAYWENLFPTAAGTCGSNTTATQCMYNLYRSGNIGKGSQGETNALNLFDLNCIPACATIGGKVTPFAFYNSQYTALYAWSSMGFSTYNAGQFTLRSTSFHGVQFDFNYTLSQSIDVGSDAERARLYGGLSAIINTWSPYQLRSPSDFDTRHNINANVVAELPFGRGKRFGSSWNRFLDSVLGGWEIAGLGRWTSGFPFSVANGAPFPTNFELGGNAFVKGQPPATGKYYLGSKGDPNAFPNGDSTGIVGQFRYAYPGESGQRNNFRGDGYFDIDAGVNKNIKLWERANLTLSAYAFNVTNSVRFDVQNINAGLDNAAVFGTYSGPSLVAPRRFEFAARLSF